MNAIDTPAQARAQGRNQTETGAVVADLFQILASPIRLAILQALLGGERCVSDLMVELDIAQSRLSNHLACLRHCGFVHTRREGSFIYYAITDSRVAEVVRLGESLALARSEQLESCVVIEQER